MACGIYCLRNKVSGEEYVGKSKDLDYRGKNHLWRLRRGDHDSPRLRASALRDGAGAFEFIVLEECDVAKLPDKELDWVTKLRPVLNCGPVGRGFSPESITTPHTVRLTPELDRSVRRFAELNGFDDTGEAIFEILTRAFRPPLDVTPRDAKRKRGR